MKRSALVPVLVMMVGLPAGTVAPQIGAKQRETGSPVRRQIEPLRVLSAIMRDNAIYVQMNNGRTRYEYLLTEARIVDGQLQFQGTWSPSGSRVKVGSPIVTATLVGTMARIDNPWPNAGQRSPSRRLSSPAVGERKAAGEITEQTQLLSAPAGVVSGCGVIYLKLSLPERKTAPPVQLGVVLAHQDNRLGEEINQAICRIVQALSSGGEDLEAHLRQLNGLLG